MNLFIYDSCDVRIIDTTGKEYTGCVITVNSADDENTDENVLTLETKEGKLYGFKESKIAKIEYID